jgi:hypothetical protein
MNEYRPTDFERAVAGYDEAFERELANMIVDAIGQASLIAEPRTMLIRTNETANALASVLALVLAMSPAACRSPTAIRKITDALGKKLRRRVAAAEADRDLQEMLKGRFFHGTDVGGRA